jgi:hypothetical protein
LSADPLGWVAARLADLDALLAEAGVGPEEVDPGDAASLRAAVPEIVDSVRRLLERVRAGEVARPPEDEAEMARVGWL